MIELQKRLKNSDFDAVIFDLDGTLIDSMWIWKDIDIEFLGRQNIPMPEKLQEFIEGMSFYETAVYFKKTFSLTMEIEEIMSCWNEMAMDRYLHEVPLKTGAKEFLIHLNRNGIRMGIATSNSRQLAEAVLKAHQIDSFFHVIVTASEVTAGKPAPDIYLRAAEELAVVPERCLIFEDLPAGITAGKNARMTACAVEDSYSRSAQAEKEQLADYSIPDFHILI